MKPLDTKKYKQFTYILGAPDIEMEYIHILLKRSGCLVVFATSNGFLRVNAKNMYQAYEMPAKNTVWIECAPRNGGKDLINKTGGVLIDHHQPGDMGYAVEPEQYMSGSSLGNLIAFLIENGWQGLPEWQIEKNEISVDVGKWDYGKCNVSYIYKDKRFLIPEDVIAVCASDHCLLSAYKGLCPGVSPEYVKAVRIKQHAKYLHKNPILLMKILRKTITEVMAKVIDKKAYIYFRCKELPGFIKDAVGNIGKSIAIETDSKYIFMSDNPRIMNLMFNEILLHDEESGYGSIQRGFVCVFKKNLMQAA